MTDGRQKSVAELSPELAWQVLQTEESAALVDCRTSQEWHQIGTPDLSQIDKAMYHVEWRQAPGMSLNPAFVEQLEAATGGNFPGKLLFICRSGARSREAATVMQEILTSKSIPCECINVAEGFEGTQTPEIVAAKTSGWRNKDLPWVLK